MKRYNEVLQQRLQAHMAGAKLSQAAAAKALGISATVVNQYLHSKYDKGNVEELESRIKEYLQLQEAKGDHHAKDARYRPAADYVQTSISGDIYDMIQYCHIERGMMVLHGDAGVGKTKGAAKYTEDHRNTTLYIQATPTTGTLNGILRMIAKVLRLPEARNRIDLEFAIRDKLDGTNKVIIIDEAQHLNIAALEEIRSLSDPNPMTGQTGAGIVLIGNTEVYSRMVGKQEARFAQLFSRIKLNRYYSTRKVLPDDVLMLFPALAPDKKALQYIHGISQSKWGIRGAVNVYNNAANNEDISYNGLHAVARNMGIMTI